MLKVFSVALPAAGLAVLLAASTAPSAHAAIKCNDEFQRVKGQDIATPYCEDAYLAAVAREHGVKVTADEVRSSAAKKYELCRFIGSDSRVSNMCPDEGGSGGRR